MLPLLLFNQVPFALVSSSLITSPARRHQERGVNPGELLGARGCRTETESSEPVPADHTTTTQTRSAAQPRQLPGSPNEKEGYFGAKERVWQLGFCPASGPSFPQEVPTQGPAVVTLSPVTSRRVAGYPLPSTATLDPWDTKQKAGEHMSMVQ